MKQVNIRTKDDEIIAIIHFDRMKVVTDDDGSCVAFHIYGLEDTCIATVFGKKINIGDVTNNHLEITVEVCE